MWLGIVFVRAQAGVPAPPKAKGSSQQRHWKFAISRLASLGRPGVLRAGIFKASIKPPGYAWAWLQLPVSPSSVHRNASGSDR